MDKTAFCFSIFPVENLSRVDKITGTLHNAAEAEEDRQASMRSSPPFVFRRRINAVNLQTIEISRIVADPEQPRQTHSEESLKGLADSIRQHGLLNPITVSLAPNTTDKYKIITGERRWRAAQLAQLKELSCVIKEVSLDDRLTEQLVENLQREDLQPLEKGKAIDQIKTSLNLTNREVSRRLALSERSVGNMLDLLTLPESIAEAVISSPNRKSDGQITEKHARFLKQLNDTPDVQNAVVERIKNEKMSSDATGNLVKALKKQPDKSKEILDAPTEHLIKFFSGGDAAQDLLDSLDPEDRPKQIAAGAQKVIDLLPTLAGIEVGRLTHVDLRQLEDALTSLQVTVEGLLKTVKHKLEA